MQSSSQTTSKMYDPLPVLEGVMRNPLPWLETMIYNIYLFFEKKMLLCTKDIAS